jgi:hypothetical protein
MRELKKAKRDRGDLEIELKNIRSRLMTEEIRNRS